MERMLFRAALALAALIVAGAANTQTIFTGAALQVAQAERAFARSMAERDHAAFSAWLSEHAVFFGPNGALRGNAASRVVARSRCE